MQMQPAVGMSELSPGAARVAAERLQAWLPLGTVVVLGDPAAALSRALRSVGVAVKPAGEADGSASLLLVASHGAQGADETRAAVSSQLGSYEGPVCLVIAGGPASIASRAFWETVMLALDWRKHPLNEVLAPYGELDRAFGVQLLGFERVPAQARAEFAMSVLEEEQELHADMSRVAGRQSDAHMARYAQAAQFVRQGDRVIDIASGLGDGTYQIAHLSRAASLLGVDASEYAVRYANANFAKDSPLPLDFMLGDAQHLRDKQDGSADFAVCIETLEHVPEPDLVLVELHRVLASGGRLYVGVSNDRTEDPGASEDPAHLHSYDWKRLRAQLNRNGFEIERAWLQNGGDERERMPVARSMLEIDPEHGPRCGGEWLLVLARKKHGVAELSMLQRVREAVLLGAEDVTDDLLRKLGNDAEVAPLLLALAHAVRGWVLLAAADERAAEAWAEVQLLARRTVSAQQEEGAGAALLALAAAVTDVLREGRASNGLLGRLRAAHGGAVQMLLGEEASAHDGDDRAFVAGTHEGDGLVAMSGREVRALIGAKDWLDGKYHEHLETIAQMEAQAAELERARRWLDNQYHSLIAEVARLSGNATG